MTVGRFDPLQFLSYTGSIAWDSGVAATQNYVGVEFAHEDGRALRDCLSNHLGNAGLINSDVRGAEEHFRDCEPFSCKPRNLQLLFEFLVGHQCLWKLCFGFSHVPTLYCLVVRQHKLF